MIQHQPTSQPWYFRITSVNLHVFNLCRRLILQILIDIWFVPTLTLLAEASPFGHSEREDDKKLSHPNLDLIFSCGFRVLQVISSPCFPRGKFATPPRDGAAQYPWDILGGYCCSARKMCPSFFGIFFSPIFLWYSSFVEQSLFWCQLVFPYHLWMGLKGGQHGQHKGAFGSRLQKCYGKTLGKYGTTSFVINGSISYILCYDMLCYIAV